jgi:peptidoglycan hydrolase-like protein with peptidoglycan-binding domain
VRIVTRQLYFGCEPGEDVMDLQDALNAVQADANQASAFARLRVDGRFDARTQSRVAEFQKLNRLAADGVVGPATWRRLRSALQGIPGLKINRPVGGGGTGGSAPPGKSGADTSGGKGKGGGTDGGGESKTGAPAGASGKIGTTGAGAVAGKLGAGALASAFGGVKMPAGAGKGGGGKGTEKTDDGSKTKGDPAADAGGGKGWTGKGGGMVAAAFGPAQWTPAFSGRYKPRPAEGKDSTNTKSDGGKTGGDDSGGGKSKGS